MHWLWAFLYDLTGNMQKNAKCMCTVQFVNSIVVQFYWLL